MSEPGQDNMEDIIKEENIRETANEVKDGEIDTLMDDYDLRFDFALEHISGFVDDIIKANSLEFRDFCEERWREAHE